MGGVRKWAWYLGGAKLESFHSVGKLWVVSAFDFVAVVVAQLGLSISEQVAKIHRRFAVCSCDLCPFYSCSHALNELDSSANEMYGI